jgi:acetyl-CoA synthetase
VFWCTADIGWITGHTYVTYGPLVAGATQVVFEGVPTYPDAGRFWQMIERHKVTVFYTAPTAIRSLIKAADGDAKVHPKNWDLSSLRILGSVGEPINPEAWMWYHKNVGGERCPIVDTFWQTETGGHMITRCRAPPPGARLLHAAFARHCGGHRRRAGQRHAQRLGRHFGGQKPWPSMIRTIWGDPERFKKSYFPDELKGYYLAGDGAVRSLDRGYFRITGRIDDVLNVSGHRMGTMEIESALVAKSDLVAEAAVVGRPDDLTGEAIVAFVVLKRSRPTGEEAKAIAKVLRDWVGKEIGPIAKPKDIRFGDNLPKTRSGKIMRRLLARHCQGRGHHARHLHAGEPGHLGAAGAEQLRHLRLQGLAVRQNLPVPAQASARQYLHHDHLRLDLGRLGAWCRQPHVDRVPLRRNAQDQHDQQHQEHIDQRCGVELDHQLVFTRFIVQHHRHGGAPSG